MQCIKSMYVGDVHNHAIVIIVIIVILFTKYCSEKMCLLNCSDALFKIVVSKYSLQNEYPL